VDVIRIPGTPNFGYPIGTHGRNGHLVVAIVDHVAQGTRFGARSVFFNPASLRSAHYLVLREGTVEQYLSEADAAFACGVDFDKPIEAYRPNLAIPWISDCWRNRVNPNLVTVNIEYEGVSGEPFTDAQLEASIDLHVGIMLRHALPVEDDRIVGHCAIDSVTRRYDPGTTFFWNDLWAGVGKILRERDPGYFHQWAPQAIAEQPTRSPYEPGRFAEHLRAIGKFGPPEVYGWPPDLPAR
jgi:N-acetyl-anhydromuramyl-L-alanine amidase AmpD